MHAVREQVPAYNDLLYRRCGRGLRSIVGDECFPRTYRRFGTIKSMAKIEAERD